MFHRCYGGSKVSGIAAILEEHLYKEHYIVFACFSSVDRRLQVTRT